MKNKDYVDLLNHLRSTDLSGCDFGHMDGLCAHILHT